MEEAEDLVARAECNVKRAEVADTGAERESEKRKGSEESNISMGVAEEKSTKMCTERPRKCSKMFQKTFKNGSKMVQKARNQPKHTQRHS